MFTRESKIILSITGLSHFAVHSSMLIFPAIILVLRSEFSADLETLGWIYMLSNFMFGLGAIPAGWLERKVGGRRLLIVYQVGMVISGLATALAKNLMGLAGALMLLGLFSSIYHPAGLTVISKRVRQTSRAMGYHGIAGSAGLAFGPLIGSWFASSFSWRIAYVGVSLFCLLLVLSTTVLIPSRHPQHESDDVVPPAVTKLRPLIVYYSVVALMGLTFVGFTTYMPTHFSQNMGEYFESLDLIIKGGLFSTAVLIAGIPGQLLGGTLGDRIDRTFLLPLIAIIQVPLLISFGFNSGYLLVFSGVFLSVVHFSFQPVGNSLIAEFTTSASRGLGYGVSFFVSFGVGSLASGLGGTLADRFGVAAVFPSVAVLMALAFFLSLYLKRIA